MQRRPIVTETNLLNSNTPPRIVVLDGYTLNPGDLDWDPIDALGQLTVHARTRPDEMVERAVEAEILLTNKTLVQGHALEKLSKLRYIGVLATGYNVVEVQAARALGIPVTNVPGYGTASVAQHVFALLLELSQRTGHHAETVSNGEWSRCPDFCYWNFPLIELAGRTLGIIGFGEIGQAVARIAVAFGMHVLVSTRTPRESSVPVEFADLDEVFRRSDVVTLHCPLTEATKGIINGPRLQLMKSSAFLINTGRGPLVDEEKLAEALNSGRIAGAGLDVLSSEPPSVSNPLIGARNCLITPHIAWATREARARLLEIAAANIRGFLSGAPCNVVN